MPDSNKTFSLSFSLFNFQQGSTSPMFRCMGKTWITHGDTYQVLVKYIFDEVDVSFEKSMKQDEVEIREMELSGSKISKKILNEQFSSAEWTMRAFGEEIIEREGQHIAVVYALHPALFYRSITKIGESLSISQQNSLLRNGVKTSCPSHISSNPTAFSVAQKDYTVYCGRPALYTGPPISIFVPTFARLKDALADIEKMVPAPPERLQDTSSLCISASQLYAYEAERVKQLKPLLLSLFDSQLEFYVYGKGGEGERKFERDAVARVQENDVCADYLMMEIKNESGIGGSSEIQVSQLYRHYTSQNKYVIRTHTCCPAILVSFSGTFIRFYGGVFTDIHIVQPLTDQIDLVITPDANRHIPRVAKIFGLIHDAITELRDMYIPLVRDGPSVSLSSRFHLCPHPTVLHPKDSKILQNLDIYDAFPQSGQTNRQHALYRAKYKTEDQDPVEVIVKFTDRYGEAAHRLLADKHYAPPFYACIPLRDNVMLVIMGEAGNGSPLSIASMTTHEREVVGNFVAEAVGALHAANMVHGDLRDPNILIWRVKDVSGSNGSLSVDSHTYNWHCQLLDFDWAGVADQVCYPPAMNLDIKWADGVAAGRPIKMEDDKSMLCKLFPRLQKRYDEEKNSTMAQGAAAAAVDGASFNWGMLQ